jgi:hypothetical protein
LSCKFVNSLVTPRQGAKDCKVGSRAGEISAGNLKHNDDPCPLSLGDYDAIKKTYFTKSIAVEHGIIILGNVKTPLRTISTLIIKTHRAQRNDFTGSSVQVVGLGDY